MNQPTSGSTSSITAAEHLITAIPLLETNSTATTRLNEIIHQNEKDSHRTSGFYENTEATREFRSRSSSSSSAAASTAERPQTKENTSLEKRNSMIHRSLEVLPRQKTEIDSQMKAVSMDMNKGPIVYEHIPGKRNGSK